MSSILNIQSMKWLQYEDNNDMEIIKNLYFVFISNTWDKTLTRRTLTTISNILKIGVSTTGLVLTGAPSTPVTAKAKTNKDPPYILV